MRSQAHLLCFHDTEKHAINYKRIVCRTVFGGVFSDRVSLTLRQGCDLHERHDPPSLCFQYGVDPFAASSLF